MYEILFTPGAAREFKDLDEQVYVRIEQAIERLSSEPRPRGKTKKLRNRVYRIRVGKFRIIYSIIEEDEVLLISRIRRRSESTYRGI